MGPDGRQSRPDGDQCLSEPGATGHGPGGVAVGTGTVAVRIGTGTVAVRTGSGISATVMLSIPPASTANCTTLAAAPSGSPSAEGSASRAARPAASGR